MWRTRPVSPPPSPPPLLSTDILTATCQPASLIHSIFSKRYLYVPRVKYIVLVGWNMLAVRQRGGDGVYQYQYQCTSVVVYQPSLPVILNLVGAAQRPVPGAAVSPAGPGRARTGPEPASSLRRRSILGMVEILCPIPGIPRPTTHNCNSVIFPASLTHHTQISAVSSHSGESETQWALEMRQMDLAVLLCSPRRY